jgi:hypothetical protein
MNNPPCEDFACNSYGMRSVSTALRSQTAEGREGLTSPAILPIVRSVAVGFAHEVATSAKEAVWQLPAQTKWSAHNTSDLPVREGRTASTRSPAAAIYAETTLGVIILLVGSFMLFGSTSRGSSVDVRMRRRLISSVNEEECFRRGDGKEIEAYWQEFPGLASRN